MTTRVRFIHALLVVMLLALTVMGRMSIDPPRAEAQQPAVMETQSPTSNSPSENFAP